MKNVLYLFCIVFSLVFSNRLSAQARKQPNVIKSNSDYVHQGSKVVFPTVLLGFKRESIRAFDDKFNDVSGVYNLKADKKETIISVYVYPVTPSNNNLRDQFDAFKEVVRVNSTNDPQLKPEFVKLKNENIVVNGLRTFFPYSLMVPDFMKGQKEQRNQSIFSLYDVGKWNLKIRITSENYDEERLRKMEADLVKYFNIEKVATENKLASGTNAKILISKTAQRDSLMIKSIIEEAIAKKEWLAENKTNNELSSGLSDFEMESHEFAINKMLQFYRENKEKVESSPLTNEYLESIQKIADNGFLKDFIYAQTYGVVNYPDGETRKPLYETFVAENNFPHDIAEVMYQIYY